MFSELLRHPGVVEVVELRSAFGFLAFHGGSLEQVTDVIARAAAARAGASVYAVLQPHDLRWHIPSSLVRPEASPALARFLDHVEVAVALHGYGREGRWQCLLAGGSNRPLAAHVGRHVRDALPGYHVVTELQAIPPELRGLHPDNPVNRPRQGGVQLELPPRVRGLGPFWEHHRRRHGPRLAPHTEALVAGLAHAALAWP
jgi:phage replication-related protein YjqB (UPF0714/DUF867 family)